MSQILKAVDDIKNFASKFRGLAEVAETLEKIGSLEQAEKEAKNKADAAVKLAGEYEIEAISKQKRVSKLDEEIEYAKKSAEEIIAGAKQRAMSIVDEAGVKGNDLLRVVSEKKVAFDKELKDLRDKMGLVTAAVSEKEAVLAAINAQINKAKEQVASLLK